MPESEAGGMRMGLTEVRGGNITDGQLGSGFGSCRRVLSVCGRPQPVQMATDPVPQGLHHPGAAACQLFSCRAKVRHSRRGDDVALAGSRLSRDGNGEECFEAYGPFYAEDVDVQLKGGQTREDEHGDLHRGPHPEQRQTPGC